MVKAFQIKYFYSFGICLYALYYHLNTVQSDTHRHKARERETLIRLRERRKKYRYSPLVDSGKEIEKEDWSLAAAGIENEREQRENKRETRARWRSDRPTKENWWSG